MLLLFNNLILMHFGSTFESIFNNQYQIKCIFFLSISDEIYNLSLASSLPTLPFEVFKQLLDSSPLTTDDGVLLRRTVIEVGAMNLVLNCLGVFTHHSQIYQSSGEKTTDVIIFSILLLF